MENLSHEKLSRKDYIKISILCLGFICRGLSFTLISSFFPISAEKKGLTIRDVGIIFSAFPVATIILSLALSKYVNKIGTRTMLLASFLIMAVSLYPFVFLMKMPNKASFYAVSVISRAGQGVAYVSGQIASFAIMASEYKEKMSTIFGFLEMSISIGVAMGPALGGFLHDTLGFEAPFYIQIGICIFCFKLTIIFIKAPSNIIDEENTTKSDLDSWKTPMSFKTFLKVPALLMPMISGMVSFIALTYVDVTLAKFMHKSFHLSPSYIGLIQFSAVIIYSILAPLIGRICDKKGYHNLLITSGYFMLFPAFLFVGPVPFFEIGLHLWSSLISLGILYIGCVFMFVPSMGLCFKIVGLYNIDDSDSAKSFLTSTFSFFGNVGNLIGPLLGGFLMNELGFGMTSGIFGLMSLLVGLASFVLMSAASRKSYRQSHIT